MEDFVPIKNYETYAINKKGEVLDLRSKKLLKQYPNFKAGNYLQVALINENGYKSFRVHRLVAETFIPNVDNKPTVDHIDRNRHNNNVDNLRWATLTEQNINQMAKGKIPHKYIMLEDCKSKKNPNASWIVNIGRIKYKKRFDYAKYTLEQIVEIRNKLLEEHNIELIE
jgi:hypothetical protein